MKSIILIAAVAALIAGPTMAQDTTPANLSTEQQKLYKLPDGTWVSKEMIIDASGADQMGAPGTGYTAPSGGSGLLGYLSGIYHAVTNTLPVGLYSAGGTALAVASSNTDTLTTNASGVLVVDAWPRLANPSSQGSRTYQIDQATAAATGVQAIGIAGASFVNVTTATTTTVKSGAGIFYGFSVNTPAATTITCYANTAASGTKIGTWTITTGQAFQVSLPTPAYVTTGITCVTANAIDVTFLYR